MALFFATVIKIKVKKKSDTLFLVDAVQFEKMFARFLIDCIPRDLQIQQTARNEVWVKKLRSKLAHILREK
jgi:hypothetical protein